MATVIFPCVYCTPKTVQLTAKETGTCSKCHVYRYCSAKCLADDWKNHKATCKKIREYKQVEVEAGTLKNLTTWITGNEYQMDIRVGLRCIICGGSPDCIVGSSPRFMYCAGCCAIAKEKPITQDLRIKLFTARLEQSKQ